MLELRHITGRFGEATGAFAVLSLYGLLPFYGQYVAQDEEKSSRAIEALLSAVRPTALLSGTILGCPRPPPRRTVPCPRSWPWASGRPADRRGGSRGRHRPVRP